ncbi:hydroxymethylglutaryl-CoA synthase [Streptomyces sp. NPDC005012]|uniref:hydroxymethylglutaryl-CoA synthase family protein n=1 Tax=unclassified Streptomyces TaxID=2593676 RepID=UPI0033A18B61
MRTIGIQALRAYCGVASVDASDVFRACGLAPARSAGLGMRRKTVALPCEDVVTYAVNAARPLTEALTPDERAGIELLVVATESGIDLSKSAATWVHRLLRLPDTCRLFEVKQACYAGLAALQLAVAQLAVTDRPDARALVIASDVPRLVRGTAAEPSQGAGAVAALLAPGPGLLTPRPEESGYHSFDVMDVCRPSAVDHVIDTDLSLLAYITCLTGSYRDFTRRVPHGGFVHGFDALAFHTPFPGAVRGAHRSLCRSLGVGSSEEVAEDFARRVEPSLRYPSLVGNAYAATTLLALVSLLDHIPASPHPRSIGVFSYGSGCSSEFCRMELAPGPVRRPGLAGELESRTEVDIAEYQSLADACEAHHAGVRDFTPGFRALRTFLAPDGAPLPLTVLAGITAHHREYRPLADVL